MSGMNRYYKLMKIYAKLWQSAAFDEDFLTAYPAEYQLLMDNDYLALEDFDIEACYKFAEEWEPEVEDFMD